MTDATKSPNHPTQYNKLTDGHTADMRKVDDILERLQAPLPAERGHKVEEEKLGCYTRHRTEGEDEKETKLDIPQVELEDDFSGCFGGMIGETGECGGDGDGDY